MRPVPKVSAGRPAAEYLRDIMPLVALTILIAGFAAMGAVTGRGRFFTTENAALVLSSSSFITVGALGMMLIIASGGIDLSAGAMLGLCTAVLAVSLRAMIATGGGEISSLAVLLCIVAAVATGAACGAANGTIISVFRVAPFIVTLGAMAVYLGLGLILCDEKTVTPPPRQLPLWLKSFASHGGMRLSDDFTLYPPPGIFVELLLAIGLWLLLRKTLFGRHLLAIGANETAAHLCGIRVTANRIAIYTLGGAFFGLAGVYQFALVHGYTPGSGAGKELDIIAAVVIGGGSLQGGRATVIGTIVGSLLTQVIRSGCTQLGVAPPYQQIIIGLIIVAAVLFDRATRRSE